jgi:hypothetical protein
MRFKLWLEFEEFRECTYEDLKDEIDPFDPDDDFCNVQVYLEDGTNYALNIWTYKYLEQASKEMIKDYEYFKSNNVSGCFEYFHPPDLFVTRLDRPTIQMIFRNLINQGQMKEDWKFDLENNNFLLDESNLIY